MYLLIGEHQPLNAQVAEHAGSIITVRGKVVSRDGISMIENAEIVAGEPAAAVAYVCPMHAEVTAAAPGKCPKCGMNLELKKEGAEGRGTIALPHAVIFGQWVAGHHVGRTGSACIIRWGVRIRKPRLWRGCRKREHGMNLIGLMPTPEHLHALLNGFVTHGLAIGILVILGGLVARKRSVVVTGLAVVAAACALVWVVMEFGEKGADRVESMSNADGQAWLDAHEERAEDAAWVFWVAALAAVATILAPLRFPTLYPALVAVALVTAIGAACAGAWIASAGGKVRHSEFRNGAPPPREAVSREGVDGD